jgi:hypothetical protein
MTLLAEIQTVLERTYRPVGLCLEKCLIGRERSRQLDLLLSGRDRLQSSLARTYLRWHQGSLYLALYYDPILIESLEHYNPRLGISHDNIHELITFIEEITHGVHAALAFQSGWTDWASDQFACNLELQARVDTYWILVLLCCSILGEPAGESTRSWLKVCLFDHERFSYPDDSLNRRYNWARAGAKSFVELCEQEDISRRKKWIPQFREMSLTGKMRFLRQHQVNLVQLLA